MLARAASTTSIVPSRNALRVLRNLALAGSTVGGFCTVAALTYEIHRRVRIAEKILENKRTLHSSAPNYDATSAAKRLKVMVDAAEAGEFMGIESLKSRSRNLPDGPLEPGADTKDREAKKNPGSKKSKPLVSLEAYHALSKASLSGNHQSQRPSLNNPLSAKAWKRNEELLEQERKQSLVARQRGKPPLESEIRRLITEGLEINAANLFLSATRPSVVISWERRNLAFHLFSANCIKGNIFTARTLFHRIAKVSSVSNEMWATLMHLLAKEGHIDSVGNLYSRYQSKFIVPKHLLEVILRCLIESNRLDGAKLLFFRHLDDDRDCGLCGAYLDGLWRKTRKIGLVLSELKSIICRLESLDRKLTEKLFNPVVKAMVETGRAEEAEALVHSMQADYGVQPGCRTLGLILYSRALSCEWDRVMDGLQKMHEYGHTSNTKDFAIVFDRLFLEYYPAHSGNQIMDFLISSINDFNITPDAVLHRHMIEAIIERGTEDMVMTITRMAKDRNWNTGLDESKIGSLIKTRRLAMEDSPVGLWRMMRAAKNSSSHSAFSRRILGSSSENWKVRAHKIAPIHMPAEESFPETLRRMVEIESPSQLVPLHKRMEQRINIGNWNDVLTIYDRAQQSGFVIRPIHLTLAMIAAILASKKHGLTNARRLVTSEWNYWKNHPSLRHSKRFTSWNPMFFQRVMKVDPDALGRGGLMKMALFEYYHVCANTDGLAVKHFCAASSARALIANGEESIAVDLLTTLYQSRWRMSHGFDQVLLKMLLRSFAKLRSLKGMWWCILTALSRNESIEQYFVAEAIAQLDTLERNSLSTTSNHAAGQMRILRHAVEVLESKSKGDAHWSAINVHPDFKKAKRSQQQHPQMEQQHLLPTTKLEDLIVNFDEEWELDQLLQRKQFSPQEHAQWWAESYLSELHSASPEDPIYPEYKPQRWADYYVPEEYSGEYFLEFTPDEFTEDSLPVN